MIVGGRKHTPGPLTVGPKPVFGFEHSILAPDGRVVGAVTHQDGQGLANANLFAAAPAMRAELDRLVHRTPFVPVEGGITITLGMEQISELRAALEAAQ